ncbi:uncharacterized protein LOC104902975 [Beta vulgaris subsp. vulgaris]|uniref:uncharacterized protein LOC104902975 n=1 Tax=Beta vulgaris subsp. vulgaris TaxID=3555 RepID=UPI0020375B89|nr:uncharacterized protein LOC104902975 [Beta vulgaris subsp. vulgaris]
MEKIKLIFADAYKWLAAIPTSQWYRHAFSTKCKSGMQLNNCCESFNNVIREARVKPVLSLMEWIRRWVMKRSYQKTDGLKKYEGLIMPSVVKMIAKQKEYVRKCDVNQADVWEFEVDYENETYAVNLLEKKCGCYRWELLGIPCCHALACIEKKRLNYEDYVHVAYHVQSYAATYAPAFHPMPGQSQWEKTDLVEPMPPTIRVMPDRPKQKKRIKEPEEGKVAREKKQNKCSNCGGLGHNKKKCKKTPQPTAPKSKGGKPKSIDPVVQNIEKKKKRKRKGTGDQVQTSTLQPPQPSQPSQSICISTVVLDFASQT